MKVQLLKADLWGNERDGYDVNKWIIVGDYELPDYIYGESYEYSGSSEETLSVIRAANILPESTQTFRTTMEWGDGSVGDPPSIYVDLEFDRDEEPRRETYEIRPIS